MVTEPLPWHRPAERMPDADLSVLLVLSGEPELEMGWWDGESWRSCVSGGEQSGVRRPDRRTGRRIRGASQDPAGRQGRL